MPANRIKRKNVALVLSSGGPRGFAYIGAIEELLDRGYTIRSVAGCSIGSLVGGVFAAGGLEQFKEWLFALTNMKVMRLLDIAINKSYIVKGDKVMEAIKEVVPDVDIETLPIRFSAVATDLYTGEEVIFRTGKLFQAIRASISIPSMFRPVKYGLHTLVDGGILNTMPIDIVEKKRGDILVGFDVNDVNSKAITEFLEWQHEKDRKDGLLQQQALDKIHSIAASRLSLIDKVRMMGDESIRLIKMKMEDASTHEVPQVADADDNYYTILTRSFNLMNHALAEKSIRLNPPDILIRMPLDAYGAISDYSKGKEIADKGRELMAAALDRYESEV